VRKKSAEVVVAKKAVKAAGAKDRRTNRKAINKPTVEE
tara:strand:- start:1339 stop:1452 length:114 start_codon:yes stop_codon:yes gene_type:complete